MQSQHSSNQHRLSVRPVLILSRLKSTRRHSAWKLLSSLTIVPSTLFSISVAMTGYVYADDECTCLWQGSFAEVAASTDLVVVGTVEAAKGNAVDISLDTTLQGDTLVDPIRIWLKARDYCRPEVERFPEGSRWLMALHQIKEVPEDGFNPSTPNISYGRKYDYQLSSCGGYFLSAEGDAVLGNIAPGMPRWAYEPDMTPVLISLVQAFLEGRATADDLKAASEEDPALRALMLDTKSFLRDQDIYLEDQAPEAE